MRGFSRTGLPFFLIPPAEDGLFLVPLIYIGINYLTAGIDAAVFAFIHSVWYPIYACIPKGVGWFLIILYVLPKGGILSAVVGHILVDCIPKYIFPLINSRMINGKRCFSYSYFYDDGTLREDGYHRNKLREGLIKYYYPSGNLQQEGLCTNGQGEGTWRWYYESGELKSEAICKNDMKESLVKCYYPSGKIQSEAYYENDKFHGPYKNYFESGALEEEGTYKEGFLNGLCKIFNEDGSLREEKNYENGQVIKF